jgi:prefoldin subunit 5
MQSHALFSTLKSRINDYNIILKKCQDAILVLKNNIEKIDTVLERANQNTSENQDTK